MNLHFLLISQLKKKKSYCDLTEIRLTCYCDFMRDHDAQQENSVHIEENIVYFHISGAVDIFIFFYGAHCNLFFNLTVSQDSRILKVDEETENTMRVTWKPAPGKVVNYRVVYRPRGGGRQMVAKVSPTVTSTVLKRLKPQTTYNITVLPIYKTGEGKLRQGLGTTGTKQ